MGQNGGKNDNMRQIGSERWNRVSAEKRDQIEIFFKKMFLSEINVDLVIWSRTCVI